MLKKNLILTSKNNFLNEKDILVLPYWIKDNVFLCRNTFNRTTCKNMVEKITCLQQWL